jgi:hypothetical protein
MDQNVDWQMRFSYPQGRDWYSWAGYADQAGCFDSTFRNVLIPIHRSMTERWQWFAGERPKQGARGKR